MGIYNGGHISPLGKYQFYAKINGYSGGLFSESVDVVRGFFDSEYSERKWKKFS